MGCVDAVGEWKLEGESMISSRISVGTLSMTLGASDVGGDAGALL